MIGFDLEGNVIGGSGTLGGAEGTKSFYLDDDITSPVVSGPEESDSVINTASAGFTITPRTSTSKPVLGSAGVPVLFSVPSYQDTLNQKNLAEQQALVDALPDWAKDWKSLWDVAKNISPNFSKPGWAKSGTSIPKMLGLGDEVVGRRISSRSQLEAMRRLEPHREKFSTEASNLWDAMVPLAEKTTAMEYQTIMNPNAKARFDYSANPRMMDTIKGGQFSRFYPRQWEPEGTTSGSYGVSKLDKDEYDAMQSKMSDLRKARTRMVNAPNTFYDLMRHGFLANEVSLPVTQLIEAWESGGQPSDFYNNVLANKFMRDPQRNNIFSGPLSTALSDPYPYSAPPFDKQRHDRLQAILGPPMSSSSGISSAMDAWDQLVMREIMNPGSTGYNFNVNTADQGVWRDEQGNRRSIMEMINFMLII